MLLGLPLLQPQQAPNAYPDGVWIDFRQGEEAHGLEYMQADQCSHQLTRIDGVGCAQTIPPNAMYLQFEAPREMILPDRDTLTFEVEVYDGDPHAFMLQVESNKPAVATGESAFRVLSTVQRQGTPKWRWVRWQVTDPAFCDPNRDAIRFRFYDEAWWNDGRLLSISQVRVTHEAVVFRPEQEAVLCGERLPVTVEAYDKAGQPLPDGTELKLASKAGEALGEQLPKSVTLTAGKADLEVLAGPSPGTVSLYGMAAGSKNWVGTAVHVLAGEGELEERTDLVTGEELATTARFQGDTVADSRVDTFTDDQGQVALRAWCSWKRDAPPGETWLLLDVPIAGLPKRFSVYLGCPDQSVDSVWARVKDREGEVFSYYLERRADTIPLPPFAERSVDADALAGPSYVMGPGRADGVIDLPCTLWYIDITPMEGLREAEIHVWGVETDVLAPPLPPEGPPAAREQP
jgi:hypothetical protein